MSYDPAILALGVEPREMYTYVYQMLCSSTFTAALLELAKNWKISKGSESLVPSNKQCELLITIYAYIN